MHDPIATSRRAVLRAVVVQAVVVGLVALAFLPRGGAAALAALVGGLAMVAGNALAAGMALGGIVPARVAFARLLLGTALKWLVAGMVFVVGVGVWRLPGLPMLAGLAAGLLAYLAALNLRVETGHPRVDRER
ncbi:hypothetical protein FQY83_05940 [Luteimonas marina]|uniref:ATP synthase subunit I n=1 Tax=Luteimonas marina TaxID=488485 RepID=A0A5C5U9G7_9GAMM|nr:hypothetical protein [Luteimonas marina]TWT22556.1 hypothetical protein FQY83_05940 [Luteimonas marina]